MSRHHQGLRNRDTDDAATIVQLTTTEREKVDTLFSEMLCHVTLDALGNGYKARIQAYLHKHAPAERTEQDTDMPALPVSTP